MTDAEFQARFRELVRGGALISDAVARAREEYHAPPNKKVCPNCGRHFERAGRDLFHWLRQTACSRRCANQWRYRQQVAA